MSTFERNILVTGGAGFIGSNLLLMLVPKYPQYRFINGDCLTYAANPSNLRPLEGLQNYHFAKIDIRERDEVDHCFNTCNVDSVIHLAAESHVDRSISSPAAFVETNIIGTFNLLEAARRAMESCASFRFHHVSTDEVFGSLGEEGVFTEQTAYRPNSPYSASKAASDHLTRAYHKTYGLNVVTTNCSNNYGPYQFPEKLIPLMVRNARDGRALPIYGDGKNIRDWLYVSDHCQAIDLVFHEGSPGQTYNIGGNNEIKNITLVRAICKILDDQLGGEKRERLIEFVTDRPGHDRRYAIDPSYIKSELGWEPAHSFEEGLQKTIKWYLDNEEWMQNCVSGEYKKYYDMMYNDR